MAAEVLWLLINIACALGLVPGYSANVVVSQGTAVLKETTPSIHQLDFIAEFAWGSNVVDIILSLASDDLNSHPHLITY